MPEDFSKQITKPQNSAELLVTLPTFSNNLLSEIYVYLKLLQMKDNNNEK